MVLTVATRVAILQYKIFHQRTFIFFPLHEMNHLKERKKKKKEKKKKTIWHFEKFYRLIKGKNQ